MLYAVIMAGGSGTRFWPASRRDCPKQLLQLAGERTMLQATAERLGPLVPPQRLLVLTSQQLRETVARQLPAVPAEAIIGEPCRRDTAAAIGLAAVLLAARDPEAVMLVLPSDHVIAPDTEFQRSVAEAVRLVESRPRALVTFGIKPSYPAESYGYIERGQPLADPQAGPGTWQVRRFCEKPRADEARRYLESGAFYWNAGIFVWRAATILEALAAHRPRVAGPLQTIAAAIGRDDFAQQLAAAFAELESVSIDYAVMEQYPQVLVIEAPFAWDDLGSWNALARLRGSDNDGNTVLGRHLGIDTAGTIVLSDDAHLVATLGVRDLIVVHTPDATLVARRGDEEAIREIVARLRACGWDGYL